MKIIIAGSREGMPEDEFKRELEGYLADENIEVSEVVCGKAKGIDTLGEMWAKQRSIPVAEFPANWERHGRAAGPIRNAEMA